MRPRIMRVIPILSVFVLLTLLGPAASEDSIDENPVAEYNPKFNLTRDKRQDDYYDDYDYDNGSQGIGRQRN